MADLQQLFQLGQQVQGRLQQLQTELANRTIETSSGGGMVKVTMTGDLKLQSIQIDPEKIGKLIGPGGKTIRGIEWSPDGKQLAFLRDMGGNERFDIWLVDRDAAGQL